MRVMGTNGESSTNPNRQLLLENVATMTAADASSFMMQRCIGVEGDLLPAHSGLEYLPASVSYAAAADQLLDHDLTEEDRNLAAALVAVQLVQQQKQQQHHHHHLQQDSNVIVSTGSLASLVTTSHLNNDDDGDNKCELNGEQQQLVITSVDKTSNVTDNYDTRHFQPHDMQLKKYETMFVDSHQSFVNNSNNNNNNVKSEFVTVKTEYEQLTEDSLQQSRGDSDGENRNDSSRQLKKTLPHKKRISRKLKKISSTASRRATVYNCTVCGQVFAGANDLETHIACHHHTVSIVVQSPTPFTCQICSTIYNDQLLFFHHLKTHYEPEHHMVTPQQQEEEEEQPSLAEVVEQKNNSMIITTQPSNLEELDEPKYSLLRSLLSTMCCTECGKTFRRQTAFESHIRDAHNKNEMSGKEEEIEDNNEFSEPEDLMEGIRGVVEANNSESSGGEEGGGADSKVWYQPNECNKPTTTTTTNGDDSKIDVLMKSRTKKKRRKNSQLFCPHCDREFVHRNSLLYHIKSHTGDRPHQCDICGKSFFAASALKVHMRLHSGDKPFKCEVCGRHFRQWGDLKYHCISIHSNQKQYQCEFCGKDFARKYSLIVHRRIHTGEKNYRCEFCGKTFRASSYLQNHRRIHTGEKPHPCDVCGKPFRVRSDMKRHLNTHSRRRTATNSATTTSAAAAAAAADAVIQIEDDSENGESIVPDDSNERVVIDTQQLIDAVPNDSEDSVQFERDPLETVREETNTLYVMPLIIS